MRILYLNSEPMDESTACLELTELAREATSRGNTVFVAAPAEEGAATSWASQIALGDLQDAPTLRGAAARRPSFAGLSEQALDDYLEALEIGLDGARKRARPEIVHVDHLWLAAAMARSIFHDVPVVASCHQEELQQASQAPDLLRRVIAPVRELDRVLVSIPELARQAGQIFGLRSDRLTVIGQGIDTSLFRPPDTSITAAFERAVKRHALAIPARHELRIAMLSSPDAPGTSAVLSAFGQVTARREGVAALVICDGQEEALEQCRHRAAQIPGLQLVGATSRGLVADVLRGCHVAVVLGSGVAVNALEALACGCRVVMPDLPSLRDWPKPGWRDPEALVRLAGLATASAVGRDEDAAVEGRLVSQLVDSLEEQLDLARQRRIDRAAVRVVSRCGWSSVFGPVERVYATLVGERG